MKRSLKILGITLAVIVILVIGALIYLQSNYNHNKIDKNNLGIEDDFASTIVNNTYGEDEGEEEEEIVDISGIKNIALFGLDRRTSAEKTTRSDSIMVATVNFDTNEIKLTSFMRDMYVEIEGHGKDKLNHSYSYGGPELAIKTLNQNFGLNIEDYVAVDFLMLERIIDVVGGVTVDVDQKEMDLINEYMKEVADKNNKSFETLKSFGTIKLNGAQAVAFSRIRYHGNGDYERTERQRIVLSAIIEELSNVNLLEVPSLATTILKNTETSINELSAINLAKNYLTGDFSSPQTERIPRDGSFTTGNSPSGAWIMKVDFEKEIDFLKGWIYGVRTAEYLRSKEQ